MQKEITFEDEVRINGRVIPLGVKMQLNYELSGNTVTACSAAYKIFLPKDTNQTARRKTRCRLLRNY